MEADVDVSDIDCEDGMVTVLTPPNEYFKTKTALTDMNADIDFEVQEITYLPQMDHPVTADAVALFERFLDMLNELEDVQEIYHNGTFED
jgi:transcriptional/translational regulatory protein YebC/TACO1